MANVTGDKTKELLEAARKRREIEQANSDQQPKVVEQRFSDEELATMKEDAEKLAEGKVQAKAGTIDGTIDIEAMGDVKGDGGDAKDYDDGDPDKALGVPTYIHGLHETKDGVDTFTAVDNESRISARTRAEQQRGREIVSGRNDERSKRVAAEEAREEREERRVTGKTTIEEPTAEEIAAAKARAKAKAEAAKNADNK